ncbi:IS66 family transposase, partial [bacterium]|nr:IS66 family transposase [bacterium]
MRTPSSTTRIEFALPLTREEAERIAALGPEATIFVMLELSARLAEQQKGFPSPTTPSGMVPPYQKPAAPKRRKKPGAKPGHPGTRRAPPPEITHHCEHPPLECCPQCGSAVGAPADRRFRLIEEVADTQPEVTKHSIPRQWCPTCRKLVEPPVADAMPGATFGHRLVALTAWLHYGVGTTISQVVAVLRHHVHFTL